MREYEIVSINHNQRNYSKNWCVIEVRVSNVVVIAKNQQCSKQMQAKEDESRKEWPTKTSYVAHRVLLECHHASSSSYAKQEGRGDQCGRQGWGAWMLGDVDGLEQVLQRDSSYSMCRRTATFSFDDSRSKQQRSEEERPDVQYKKSRGLLRKSDGRGERRTVCWGAGSGGAMQRREEKCSAGIGSGASTEKHPEGPDWATDNLSRRWVD
jgi:hypothetical protein